MKKFKKAKVFILILTLLCLNFSIPAVADVDETEYYQGSEGPVGPQGPAGGSEGAEGPTGEVGPILQMQI